MLRQFALLLVLLATTLSCSSKPQAKGPAHHYPVSGRVMSLDNKNQTVSLDAGAIPGYMEAMKMDYPVASRKDFDLLHVGDTIEATVNVYDSGDFDISSVHPRSPGK